jgi:hypothetical protein
VGGTSERGGPGAFGGNSKVLGPSLQKRSWGVESLRATLSPAQSFSSQHLARVTKT